MSFGFSLTLISLILLNSPKYMKKMEMSEKDERLVMIKDKQLSTAYSFNIFFSAVLTVIFGLKEETYMISVAIASILLVEGLFLFLIQKRSCLINNSYIHPVLNNTGCFIIFSVDIT